MEELDPINDPIENCDPQANFDFSHYFRRNEQMASKV